jgi:ssDNA-binding Zn-finger/Zn-ribbon topoisomerase 1
MSIEEAKAVAQFLLDQCQNLHKPTIPAQDHPPNTPKIISSSPAPKDNSEKSFVPKVGAICPQCKKHNLIRKSVMRGDNTETDFLACAAYPVDCKAIFALVAVARKVETTENMAIVNLVVENKEHKENDTCPRCKSGKLILRKAKTEFLGCSQYPKCKFTDYRN